MPNYSISYWKLLFINKTLKNDSARNKSAWQQKFDKTLYGSHFNGLEFSHCWLFWLYVGSNQSFSLQQNKNKILLLWCEAVNSMHN